MPAAEKKPFVCTVAPFALRCLGVKIKKKLHIYPTLPSLSLSVAVSVACYPSRFPWQLAMPFGGNFRANCQVLFGFRVLCMQNLTNFHNIHTTSTHTRVYTHTHTSHHNERHTSRVGKQTKAASSISGPTQTQTQTPSQFQLSVQFQTSLCFICHVIFCYPVMWV